MDEKDTKMEKPDEQNPEEPILWQAPEYEYKSKTVSWYWMSAIIAMVLIILSLWQKNFLFAVFIFIAELVLIYFSGRFPKIWEFKINEKGIAIGDVKFYEFGQIQAFDIHPFDNEYKELVFRLKPKFSPYLKIFIYVEDEKKIEERLKKFLEREEFPQSLADTLENFFRF